MSSCSSGVVVHWHLLASLDRLDPAATNSRCFASISGQSRIVVSAVTAGITMSIIISGTQAPSSLVVPGVRHRAIEDVTTLDEIGGVTKLAVFNRVSPPIRQS